MNEEINGIENEELIKVARALGAMEEKVKICKLLEAMGVNPHVIEEVISL